MADERRKKLIQLIHAGKAKLGWDEEAYRAFLWGLTGKDSAALLGIRELERVLKEMRRLGFAERPVRVRREEKGRATYGQLEYIKGMWAVCARNKSERALAAFVKRVARVDALRFLTVLTAQEIILALRDMMEKAGFDPDTSERLKK